MQQGNPINEISNAMLLRSDNRGKTWLVVGLFESQQDVNDEMKEVEKLHPNTVFKTIMDQENPRYKFRKPIKIKQK